MSPPVWTLQTSSPVSASTAYTWSSAEPKKTVPSATAGVDQTAPSLRKAHRWAPVAASTA